MILNKKGKPFSWSYSAVNDFDNCPLSYAGKRYFCTSPFIQSEAIKWGNRVHKSAELFLKAKSPYTDPEALAPVEKYCTAMIRSGLRVEAENEIALDRNFKSVSWFSKKAWFRIKIDVILTSFDKKHAHLYDFKTGGKIREAPDQLRLTAAALSAIRPEIETFKGKFIWTKHQEAVGVKPITRAEIPSIWQEFIAKATRMEESWRTERFPARPSGLCPWCAVSNCVQRRGVMR